MKLNQYIYASLVLIAIGFIFILVLDSLVLGIIFFLPMVFLYLNFINPLVKRVENRMTKIDELYTFINTTIAQLKVDKSLTVTFKNVAVYWPKTIQKTYDTFQMDSDEFLKLLKDYFKLSYFDLFLNILKVHTDKGGDLTDRANSLLNGIGFTRLMLTELYKTKLRKLTEFIVMWMLAFTILLYMRFGLSTYYLNLLETNFIYAVIASLVLFIMSSYFAMATFNQMDVNIL